MIDASLQILQHALGVDQYGHGQQYRNHFCTSPGGKDYPGCMELVDQGLMTRHAGSAISGGAGIFILTRAGKAFVAENCPSPPKLTRSQRRYRYWVSVADCFPDWRFGDWLKSEYVREI
jgi:hypothetical protein